VGIYEIESKPQAWETNMIASTKLLFGGVIASVLAGAFISVPTTDLPSPSEMSRLNAQYGVTAVAVEGPKLYQSAGNAPYLGLGYGIEAGAPCPGRCSMSAMFQMMAH
jgi:hypothetical protein